MKLSRGVVLIVIWVFSVAGYRPCPENCKKIPPRSTCNTDTGTCSRGCVPGYYGNTCNLTCDVHCEQGTCLQRDGLCNCIPGYTFNSGSCDSNKGVKCELNDHCLNNRCFSASRQDCLEGCKHGWFGELCQLPCSPYCICDDESGNCTSCIPEWYGAECGTPCSQDCVDKTCDRDGTCSEGCRKGFYGEKCESTCPEQCYDYQCDTNGTCTTCRPGFYGAFCRQTCHRCINNVCDMLTGECLRGCQSSFYGEGCTETCSKCTDGACTQTTGACTKGCQRGYYGPYCTKTCETCKDGVCNQTTGACTKGCQRGYYGPYCTKTCETCTDGVCNQTTGACTKGCQRGYYGPDCTRKCETCIDGVCNGTTGKCMTGCVIGYYGSFCNLTCEHCIDGDCDRSTGECRYKDEDGENWSAIGGGMAVVIFILIVVGMFYMFRRLKRVNGVVYDIVKWRRRSPSAVEDVRAVAAPGYIELEEQAPTNPPRVCPIRPARQTSYIEPQHSGGSASNLQIQCQLQVAGASDQQDDEHQAAAVSSSHDVQRRSDESHDRPDSYVLPNYCEVDEELMATLPQGAQGAEAPAPVVNYSSFCVVADVHAQHEERDDGDADLTIPLIAECYGPTETENSTSEEEPRPNVENYEHPFKNHYTQF